MIIVKDNYLRTTQRGMNKDDCTSKRQRAHLYVYKKQKKRNVLIYKKLETFQKLGQSAFRFIYNNKVTLR